jgi:CheY-like chemotaxis protein
MAVDRQLAADVVHLLHSLPEFEGVYVRRHASGDQLAVPILDDRARARAAALLSTLVGNQRVQLVASALAPGMGAHVDLFDDELAAAARRADERRVRPTGAEVRAIAPRARRLLLVSRRPQEDIAALRAGDTPAFDATLATSTQDADVALQTADPDVVVIDVSLPGAIEFESALCALYPKFRIYDNVHWVSSIESVGDSRARILNALFGKAHLTTLGPFAGLRLLVADAPDFVVTRELVSSIPELRPRASGGWDLLGRLREGPDAVIIGRPKDFDVIELFRAVRKTANVRIIIALEKAAIENLRTTCPWLEHGADAPYLLARPIRPADLARITQRPFKP